VIPPTPELLAWRAQRTVLASHVRTPELAGWPIGRETAALSPAACLLSRSWPGEASRHCPADASAVCPVPEHRRRNWTVAFTSERLPWRKRVDIGRRVDWARVRSSRNGNGASPLAAGICRICGLSHPEPGLQLPSAVSLRYAIWLGRNVRSVPVSECQPFTCAEDARAESAGGDFRGCDIGPSEPVGPYLEGAECFPCSGWRAFLRSPKIIDAPQFLYKAGNLRIPPVRRKIPGRIKSMRHDQGHGAS